MVRAVVRGDGGRAREAGRARGDGGTLELEAEDGTYVIALRSVVFLKRFSRETRIGFGAAG